MTFKRVRARYVGVRKYYRFPGDFKIHTYPQGQSGNVFRPVARTYLFFLCPCGVCGWEIDLPIYLKGQPKCDSVAWEWDGNLLTPTLTPSIRRRGDCTYHGYMTAGKWNWCPDSMPPHVECRNRGRLV